MLVGEYENLKQEKLIVVERKLKIRNGRSRLAPAFPDGDLESSNSKRGAGFKFHWLYISLAINHGIASLKLRPRKFAECIIRLSGLLSTFAKLCKATKAYVRVF